MKKMILMCAMLFLSNGVFANEVPKTCPNVNEIIKAGLSEHLVQDNDGKWYAGRSCQSYDTKEHWTFVIGGITAPDKNTALLKAKQALLTLTFLSGPKKAPAEKWLCLYNNAQNYLSGAVTPPINDGEYNTLKL
jgi:hypothetical protein